MILFKESILALPIYLTKSAVISTTSSTEIASLGVITCARESKDDDGFAGYA